MRRREAMTDFSRRRAAAFAVDEVAAAATWGAGNPPGVIPPPAPRRGNGRGRGRGGDNRGVNNNNNINPFDGQRDGSDWEDD